MADHLSRTHRTHSQAIGEAAAFGEAGNGIFPAPAAIAEEVEQMYHCRRIGPAIEVEETYYAISPERKLKHPAVLKIIDNAKRHLLTR